MTIALLETWLAASGAGEDSLNPSLASGPALSRNATSIDDTDDRVLAERIRVGDSLAFDVLAQRYIPTLVRFATALLGDRDVAEDVVQIVLARMWERFASFVPAGSVVAYLCAAVRNQALDTRRRDEVRHRKTAAAIDGSATVTTPDVVEERNDIIQLRRAFFTLPEHYRAALQLRYGQRMGYAEIAEALRTSSKGAERTLARAIAALRRAFEETEA